MDQLSHQRYLTRPPARAVNNLLFPDRGMSVMYVLVPGGGNLIQLLTSTASGLEQAEESLTPRGRLS